MHPHVCYIQSELLLSILITYTMLLLKTTGELLLETTECISRENIFKIVLAYG